MKEFARADVAFLIIMTRNQRGPDSVCWHSEGHICSRYPILSHDEELLSSSLGHFGRTVHSTPDSHADGARLSAPKQKEPSSTTLSSSAERGSISGFVLVPFSPEATNGNSSTCKALTSNHCRITIKTTCVTTQARRWGVNSVSRSRAEGALETANWILRFCAPGRIRKPGHSCQLTPRMTCRKRYC